MNRLTSLPFMFRVVAIVELLYGAVGLLIRTMGIIAY